MTPEALSQFLSKLVKHKLFFSTMIWGAPGIGKSSIVAQVARAHEMELIDLRLSQLAPTDLRGLPVADKMMASKLYDVGLDIGHVVGQATAAEFAAFLKLYTQLPDIDNILQGQGKKIPFPEEPSQRYAITVALTMRAESLQQSYQAFQWIADKAGQEWIQLFATDLFRRAQSRNELGRLALLVQQDRQLQQMFLDYMKILEESECGHRRAGYLH